MPSGRVAIITNVNCQHCGFEEERYVNLEEPEKVYCSRCDKDTGFIKQEHK